MVENFILEDKSKGNHIDCKVDSDKDFLEMKLGDKTAFVRMDDLYSLCLLILKPDQRDSLIPIQQASIRKYFRQHRVKTKKDIKKGQEVVVNCEIDVPLVIEENIKAFLKPKSSLLIT